VFAMAFELIGARQVLVPLLVMSLISFLVFTQAIRKRTSRLVAAG